MTDFFLQENNGDETALPQLGPRSCAGGIPLFGVFSQKCGRAGL